MLKIGDKVKCIWSDWSYLTVDKIYTVMNIRNNLITVVDDKGCTAYDGHACQINSSGVYTEKFILEKIEEKVDSDYNEFVVTKEKQFFHDSPLPEGTQIHLLTTNGRKWSDIYNFNKKVAGQIIAKSLRTWIDCKIRIPVSEIQMNNKMEATKKPSEKSPKFESGRYILTTGYVVEYDSKTKIAVYLNGEGKKTEKQIFICVIKEKFNKEIPSIPNGFYSNYLEYRIPEKGDWYICETSGVAVLFDVPSKDARFIVYPKQKSKASEFCTTKEDGLYRSLRPSKLSPLNKKETNMIYYLYSLLTSMLYGILNKTLFEPARMVAKPLFRTLQFGCLAAATGGTLWAGYNYLIPAYQQVRKSLPTIDIKWDETAQTEESKETSEKELLEQTAIDLIGKVSEE